MVHCQVGLKESLSLCGVPRREAQECEDARGKIMESRDRAKSAAQLVSSKHAVIEIDKKLTMQTETRRCDILDKFEHVDRELSDICERLVELRTEYQDAVLASNGNTRRQISPLCVRTCSAYTAWSDAKRSEHTRYGHAWALGFCFAWRLSVEVVPNVSNLKSVSKE